MSLGLIMANHSRQQGDVNDYLAIKNDLCDGVSKESGVCHSDKTQCLFGGEEDVVVEQIAYN